MAGQLVWLITGTTSGLGRELALEALSRGDKVIATGRKMSFQNLDDLKAKGADALELDVTSPLETLQEVAKKAVAIHGRIDVVVNNAGYILVGPIEENTPQETFDQFNTNVFGAMNVARAFLPYMRERKTGTVVNIGSVCGHTWIPYYGVYSASKWALRGLSLTLHEEIAPLGLRSTCVDFGYFRTPILGTAQRGPPRQSKFADYKEITAKGEASTQSYDGKQPGNPKEGVRVIVDVVRGEGSAAGKFFPTNLCLGSDCLSMAKNAAEGTLKDMEVWKDVSVSTDFKE